MNLLFHLVSTRRTQGGADVSYYELINGLKERGHAVVLMVDAYPKRIKGIRSYKSNRKHYKWADVIITHPAVRMWDVQDKPVLALIHSGIEIERWNYILSLSNTKPIFASKAIRSEFGSLYSQSPISYPIIQEDQYKVETSREYITLVGTSKGKGFNLFCEIAEEMPDKKFLSVQGGWGNVYVPDKYPPNLTLWHYQADPRTLYEKTGLLLYIGDSSSGWLRGVGRVMIEAAYSGIPSVVSNGPGLLEFGIPYGRVFSLSAPAWVQAIRNINYEIAIAHTNIAVQRYPTKEQILNDFEQVINESL